MPVLDYDEAVAAGTGTRAAETWAPSSYVTPFSVAAPLYLEQSPLGSFAHWAANRILQPWDPRGQREDPSYDPFAGMENTPYAQYASSFIDVSSPEEAERVRRDIDHEQWRNEQLSNVNLLTSIAGIGINLVADPTVLIPVGLAMKAATAGGRVALGAAEGALAGVVGASASEAILQGTQETRSWEDSAFTILTSGALGAGLGALAPMFTAGGSKLIDRIGRARSLESGLDDYSGGSLSAARKGGDTTLGQEGLKGAFGLERVLTPTSPLLRAAASPSIVTRQVMQQLAEDGLVRAKNTLGLASEVSTTRRIAMHRASLADGLVSLDHNFVEYRAGKAGGIATDIRLGVGDITGQTGGKLTRRQFAQEVGKAMIRGDEHDIPEVARAAKAIRQAVFDPLRDQAILLGLLPPGVESKVAASYLMRLYDRGKIAARRKQWTDKSGVTHEGFEDRIVTWLEGRQRSLASELEVAHSGVKAATSRLENIESGLSNAPDLQKEKANAQSALEKAHAYRDELNALASMEPSELRAIAQQVTDKILAHERHGLNYEAVPIDRGPLKSLTLTIPTKDIEDFLDTNVERVAKTYHKVMSTDVELTRMFGSADMRAPLEDIRSHYALLRAEVTDPKVLNKLNTNMEHDLRDVSAVRDRVRGTYGIPTDPYSLGNRIVRTTKSINYLRALGGMAISSLPDAAMPIFVHGPMAVMGKGLLPLLSNSRGFKMAAQEVRMAGAAMEMVLDGRAHQIGDLVDEFAPKSKFEKGVEYAADKFGLMTLMDPWTVMWKNFSGVISQSRTLDAATAWERGAIKKGEMERLAQLGIDEGMAGRITRQFEMHGEDQGTIKWANTQAWTDEEAALHYRAALAKDIDRTIITPGQEKPLWMSRPLGQVMGQFQSFTIASMQRVLLAGLQRRDTAALAGFIGLTGMGMLTYWIQAHLLALGHKDKTAEDFLSENPAQWVFEGVDRSGALGYAFQIDHALDIATRGHFSARAVAGGDELSRFRLRNGISSLGGPTVSAFNDLMTVSGAAATGEWSAGDIHAARGLIPLNNVFWWRWMFNKAEDRLAGD